MVNRERVRTEADHSVSRRTVRFDKGDSFHDSGAYRSHSGFDHVSIGASRPPFVSSGQSARTAGSYLSYGTARSSAFEVASNVSDRSATFRKNEGSLDRFGKPNITTSQMVDFGRRYE